MTIKSNLITGAIGVSAAVVTMITGAQIQDHSIWQSDMAGPVNAAYLGTYNNTVGDPQLKSGVRNDLLMGKLAATAEIPATTITNIGGTFSTRATDAGKITLPAGHIYEVQTQFKIERTVDGDPADPAIRPQVALRYSGSGDAGTSMGVEISKNKSRELIGTTVGYVDLRTATGPTDVTVYFFGYTDTGSEAGSGQMKGEAHVAAKIAG